MLAASSVALTVVYRNDIVKAALATVAQNNELNFTSRDVDVKLSRNLRNTTLLFSDVDVSNSSASDASGAKFDLRMATLRMEVDLLRFALRKEITVKKLLASDGELRLRLARSKNSTAQSDFRMPDTEELLREVSRVQLDRCRLNVEDASGGSVAVDVKSLNAGMEKKDNGKLNLHAKGAFTLLVSDRKNRKRQTATDISIDVRGSLAQGVATIVGSKIGVDGVALEAKGNVAFRPLGKVNLRIACKNLPLKSAVAQAQKYATFNAPEQLSGRASADVSLTGSLKKKATLSLAATGTVRNAEVKLKDAKAVATEKLHYTVACSDVKNLKTYTCTVNSDNVLYYGFALGGEATVSNFKSPVYDANARFSGDVASLGVASLSEGKVEGQAQVRATALSSEGVELLSVQASVSDLQAKLQGEAYTLSGLLSADKNTLLAQLSISCEAAECAFDGAVQGYLPTLIDKGKLPPLNVHGKLNAGRLNVDKLLQGDSAAFGLGAYARLDVQANEVTLFGYTYRNVSGAIGYNARRLTVDNLKAAAFDGTLGGDVKFYTPTGKNNRLVCDLYFNGIRLENLPYLSKNFGVKPGSMQGKCDGSVTLTTNVGTKGVDMDNLSATADLTINSGRLLAFEPIQPLSTYLKKSLLQDVRFSALKNTISIEKGKISIPKMEVRSTALNVLIAGTQELKGDFDYHITLYVSELLSGKEKNIENPIKEDKTKLFLHFTSKNGVTEVTHDRQEWSKNVGRKLQRETQEVKSLLRTEAEADGSVPSAAQKGEKIAVEWEEDVSIGAAKKTEQKSKIPPKKPEAKKQEVKKQRAAVEVEWEE
ncbi:MAG: AsmA-like C-terminal region-containing protein [Prevotellaceae bacterium]|nr:AsmA-like C-terminal region-containing protein [Prevotellaceae bacterium]